MSYKFSLRNKIMILIIIITAITSIALLFTTYKTGEEALTKSISKQLTSIRAAKEYQIEHYFHQLQSFVEVMGHNDHILKAMKEFKRGYNELSNTKVPKECTNELAAYYEDYVGKISQNLKIKRDIELFYPQSLNACNLQFNYIIKNPYPVGERHLFSDAGINTTYNAAHARHHNYLTDLILEYGFYDIFLIDLKSGNIVYTATKEADFATNLYTGPYAESNLASLARSLREKRDMDETVLIDYAVYRPSFGAPAAFLGIAITEGAETVGALVFQLPVDEINKIMTGNMNWENDGLGSSGESYLVGEDFTMRSVSRFFLEDTVGYTKALVDLGVEEEEVNGMYQLGTSILKQRVKTEGVKNAFYGKEETKIIQDYRGVDVLSSYAPINVKGLKWVILSEIDMAEAKLPIINFQRKVFVVFALLLTLVSFLALWLSNKLTYPLIELKDALLKIKNSDKIEKLKFANNDELGILGQHFNELTDDLKLHKSDLSLKKEANEQILLNFMPESIAKRLQNGETDLVETHEDVSLIVIDIDDFSDFVKIKGDKDSVGLLNILIDALDEAADRHHIEKLRTIGDTYIASCGILNQRTDHIKRAIEFADDAIDIIIKFNDAHPEFELTCHIGIASGEVVAAIVGTAQFNFDILGKTMDQVMIIKDVSQENAILVSGKSKEKMKDFFKFKKVEAAKVDFEIWEVLRDSINDIDNKL